MQDLVDNCLLSSETQFTKPEAFADEDPDVPNFYFEVRATPASSYECEVD